MNALLGAILVFVIVAGARPTGIDDAGERTSPLVTLLLLSGGVQIFFGYIEAYAPLLFFAGLYVWAAHRTLVRGASLWGPVVFAARSRVDAPPRASPPPVARSSRFLGVLREKILEPLLPCLLDPRRGHRGDAVSRRGCLRARAIFPPAHRRRVRGAFVPASRRRPERSASSFPRDLRIGDRGRDDVVRDFRPGASRARRSGVFDAFARVNSETAAPPAVALLRRAPRDSVEALSHLLQAGARCRARLGPFRGDRNRAARVRDRDPAVAPSAQPGGARREETPPPGHRRERRSHRCVDRDKRGPAKGRRAFREHPLVRHRARGIRVRIARLALQGQRRHERRRSARSRRPSRRRRIRGTFSRSGSGISTWARGKRRSRRSTGVCA